jgi:hypothetical protein
MNGNAAFAVPKDRQRVMVHLDKGVALEGEIFLEFFSHEQSAHQKVTSFLENDSVFFPLKVSATGATEFVNRKNIGIVEVDTAGEPDPEYFSFQILHTIPVTVILRHGDAISGLLMAEVPQDKARLSDCLNLPDRFLSVKTAGKIYYINKTAVQKVLHADKR